MPLYWAALFLIFYLIIGNSISSSILVRLDLMWYVVFVIIVVDFLVRQLLLFKFGICRYVRLPACSYYYDNVS